MSLNIFWDKITQEHAKLAQDFLNEQLRNAPIPDVVGPIVISDLTFGDSPPDIKFVDFDDPFEALLNPPDPPAPGSTSPVLFLREGHVVPRFCIENSHEIPRVPCGGDIMQARVRVTIKDTVKAKVSTAFALNTPVPLFISLPVSLALASLHFDAEVIVMYREDSEVRISLLHSCPEMRDPSQRGLCNHSPLIAMELESEIGDSSQKDGVLRDLDKVERFLVDQIRKFLYEHMSYPRSYSIPLPKQGDGGKSETEGGGGAQGVTGGGEDVLSQEPSETDHTKWEGTA